MYRQSADIEETLRALPKWSSVVTRIPLADAHSGQPISAIRIRRGTAADRRGVLFVAGLHGREAVNPDLLLDFAIGLAVRAHDGADWRIGLKTWDAASLSTILDTLDIFLLPNANPDGRDRALGSDRMWRKNTRFIEYRPYPEQMCIGVDLNRNFDLVWGKRTLNASGGDTSSRNACSEVFVGPRAFSEVESRNVKALLDDHPIMCMVDLHSFGEHVLYPWGHAGDQTSDPSQQFTEVDMSDWDTLPGDAPGYREYISPVDQQRFETVGQAVADAIREVRPPATSLSDRPQPNYTVHPGSSLYPATGTSADYAYSRHIADPRKRKIYGFTLETGQENFWSQEESFQPSPGEAGRIKEEVASGLLAFLASCICTIDVIGRSLLGAAGSDRMAAMRDMRDRRLAGSAAGRSWIALLERHQLELAALTAKDAALRALAGELIADAGELLRGDEPMDEKTGARVRRLLDGLARKRISVRLKRDLGRLEARAVKLAGRRASDIVQEMTERGIAERPDRNNETP